MRFLAGEIADCPHRAGNNSLKSLSRYNVPNSSYIFMYIFPFGNDARATRPVSSGTSQ
jgi:hypothetical protein